MRTKLLPPLVAAGVIAFSSAAGATGLSAAADAGATSNSAANVTIDGSGIGLGLGGASVGAAECAEAVAFLGLFAQSRTDEICRAAKTSIMFCKAGYLTGEECRRAAIMIMKRQGLNLGPAPAAAATSAATSVSTGDGTHKFKVDGGTVTCIVEGGKFARGSFSSGLTADYARGVCTSKFPSTTSAAPAAKPKPAAVQWRTTKGTPPALGMSLTRSNNIGCNC